MLKRRFINHEYVWVTTGDYPFKERKDICILAHSYQAREIVEIADFAGDSFQLSVMAEKHQIKPLLCAGFVLWQKQ